MADYVLSQRADQDLTEIYRYSLETFGETQADGYFLGLENCLYNLAGNPLMGHPAGDIEQGLYRFVYSSHTIFYVVAKPGIFVARILHQSMDQPRHLEAD